jgi:hypothetical protein
MPRNPSALGSAVPEVMELLGAGGMGGVYCARDTEIKLTATGLLQRAAGHNPPLVCEAAWGAKTAPPNVD